MKSLQAKRELIFKAEEAFAFALAKEVIEKPHISVWMILIPIIFVFHIYRHKKYVEGCNQFADNYLVSRERALDEAVTALEAGRKPDIQALVQKSSSPSKTANPYAQWMRFLTEHYLDLLKSQGNTIEELIRATYKKRNNYLLFLNQLNNVEKQFDAALKPFLYETTQGVDQIVQRMEKTAEALRREMAQNIFS
jgi:hypothetical protein